MVAPLVFKTTTYTRTRPEQHPLDPSLWTNQPILHVYRTGFNQKPPYNIDSELYLVRAKALTGHVDARSWTTVDPEGSDAAVEAANKARAKFVGQLGDASQFGSTLTAELSSTWGTVAGGVTKALLAMKAVKQGQLGEAARILSFAPPEKTVKVLTKVRGNTKGNYYRNFYKKKRVWVMPNGKEVTKSLGNKWLWYSYGVKPLIEDIYNGMDVLTREIPNKKLSVGASARSTLNIGGFYRTRVDFKSSCRVSAEVRVTNPNLWLANQLGLINPAQWFLEGVKLSFVVDWFSNLSQVVQQMTDFVGLKIEKPVTTSKHTGTMYEFHPDYSFDMNKERIVFTRKLSIPEAKLRFAYERFSWQRGLNAISLLVGGLKNTKH